MSPLRGLLFALLLAAVVAIWVLTCVSERFERVASGVAALEPRSYESLTVVTAGTGGSFANHRRLGPAVAVGHGETLALVDAGRAAAEALRKAEIPASQPRAVLLTSLQPENTLGLDDLWLAGWLGGREAPLRVYGPEGTGALVEGLRRAHARDARALRRLWELPAAGGGLEARELSGEARLEIGGLRVRAAELPGGPLPALAYRFEAGGRAAVVAAAGWGDEALAELAAGVELLVQEAVYEASVEAALEAGAERAAVIEREAAHHPTLREAGALAARAGVRTLVLTRLRPPPVFDFQYTRVVGERFEGRVQVAEDGASFTPGRRAPRGAGAREEPRAEERDRPRAARGDRGGRPEPAPR